MFLRNRAGVSTWISTKQFSKSPAHPHRIFSLFSYSTVPPKAVISHTDKDVLHLHWTSSDQTPSSDSAYSFLWLRDNCQCEKCIHPSSQQKMHSSADIPLDIAPTDVRVHNNQAQITWNKPLRHQQKDSHISTFPLSFLANHHSPAAQTKFRFNHLQPVLWSKEDYKAEWISYEDYMTTDKGLHEAVQRLYNKGLVFLKDVPLKDSSATQVAERIGPVHETFYGRDFDVKNIAKSTNIAYTSLYLGFHMDLMYMDSPPGIQLLHSLKNSVTGGSSIFVDSFQAAAQLKEAYPEDYEILQKTPVTFHYLNNGHHMHYRRPTLVMQEQGVSAWDSHVNYAPQFQGPMEFESPHQAASFYRAFQRLANIIEDPALRFELTLQPGHLGRCQ
ncbi:hypothetical protein BDF14DRAFT_1796769 [Spinellus fusiger]|nr:hypothetical protein BDF14DRAFT_1796769 [Spinellus fusiger]